MTIISDETGTYSIGADGEKNYGCMTSCKINDKVLYDFDDKTGTLQVSMGPKSLEILLKNIGEIPKKGKDLTLPTPFGLQGGARFKGVKKIVSIPVFNEEDYLIKLVPKKSPQGLLIF